MMQRTVVNFQQNTPQTVLLDKGPEGRETASKINGAPQWQYTVNSNSSVMWLPEQARAALLRSGALAGDTVEICRQANGWKVQLLTDAEEPQFEEEPEPPRRQMRVVAPQQQGQPQPSNGANALRPKPTPQPSQTVPESSPMEDLLTRCFTVAGRALWNAYRQLTADGFEIEPPNFEDVRAGGISLFIDRQRNGNGDHR